MIFTHLPVHTYHQAIHIFASRFQQTCGSLNVYVCLSLGLTVKALSMVFFFHQQKYMQEARSKGVRGPKISLMTAAEMLHTNWRFVETLLKEGKLKVRMQKQKVAELDSLTFQN